MINLCFQSYKNSALEDHVINNTRSNIKTVYEEKVVYHILQSSTSNFQLESAFLGQSKSCLDQIELSIGLLTAISNYGGFLKYHVIDITLKIPHPHEILLCIISVCYLSQVYHHVHESAIKRIRCTMLC